MAYPTRVRTPVVSRDPSKLARSNVAVSRGISEPYKLNEPRDPTRGYKRVTSTQKAPIASRDPGKRWITIPTPRPTPISGIPRDNIDWGKARSTQANYDRLMFDTAGTGIVGIREQPINFSQTQSRAVRAPIRQPSDYLKRADEMWLRDLKPMPMGRRTSKETDFGMYYSGVNDLAPSPRTIRYANATARQGGIAKPDKISNNVYFGVR